MITGSDASAISGKEHLFKEVFTHEITSGYNFTARGPTDHLSGAGITRGLYVKLFTILYLLLSI